MFMYVYARTYICLCVDIFPAVSPDATTTTEINVIFDSDSVPILM